MKNQSSVPSFNQNADEQENLRMHEVGYPWGLKWAIVRELHEVITCTTWQIHEVPQVLSHTKSSVELSADTVSFSNGWTHWTPVLLSQYQALRKQ